MKQMPSQIQGAKPTIAIITSKYYEKLAVDAMMEDKTTFVKYKTEGISDEIYSVLDLLGVLIPLWFLQPPSFNRSPLV